MPDDSGTTTSPSHQAPLHPEPPQPPWWDGLHGQPHAAPPVGRARRGGWPSLRAFALAVVAGLVLAFAVGVPLGIALHNSRAHGGATPAAGPSGPAGGSQATAAYRQALAALARSSGFHYIADTGGPEPERIVGDAGPSGGRQVITFTATYGTERFTLLLVNGVVYFQGNVPAIQDQLGVSNARAARLQNTWIGVHVGEGPYNVLQPGITVSDQGQEIPLVPRSMSNASVAGVQSLRISGTVPAHQGIPAGTAHMDVAPDTHLPIDYTSSVSGSGVTLSSTTNFSDWGATPSVSAPAASVAWNTLGASEPPGGYGSGGTGGQPPSPSPQGSI